MTAGLQIGLGIDPLLGTVLPPAEARRIAREAAAGDRERARAKAEAARELARETAVRGARLNDEEREALRQKARALRSEAERRADGEKD